MNKKILRYLFNNFIFRLKGKKIGLFHNIGEVKINLKCDSHHNIFRLIFTINKNK